MASVADEIIASPYAIIGSIGVVATVPNFSARLAREGVSVEEVTAGQYKRTLTPYSTPTSADREKVRHDIQAIHDAFKNSIKKNRPNLNINTVATGETWLATDALKRGLVDGIHTFDEILVSEMHKGHGLFEIQYDPIRNRKRSPFNFSEDVSLGSLISWASQVLLKEIYSNSNRSPNRGGIGIGSTVGVTTPLSDPVRQIIASNDCDGNPSGLPYTPMMYAGNVHMLSKFLAQADESNEEEN